LGKAEQSSLSSWSKPDDAQRAVQKGEWDFAFHTEKEQNPWWELTLDRPNFVEYIVLHNRKSMCQERSRKLSVEVFDGEKYHQIYQGDLLFGSEPNGLPLILPVKYPKKIEKIKITLLAKEFLHLSRVNVLSLDNSKKYLCDFADSGLAHVKLRFEEQARLMAITPPLSSKKINVCILGTSNSVMKDGYVVGLLKDNAINIHKNISVGSSQAAIVPYCLSKHSLADCDVVVLDLLVNEQRALWLHDYDISLSSQIFDYFLSVCSSAKVLPIVLLMPELTGYQSQIKNEKFQKMRKHYIDLCSQRSIPYYDGYAHTEHLSESLKIPFAKLFKDLSHMLPIYAQNIGVALAKAIGRICDMAERCECDLMTHDFGYTDLVSSSSSSSSDDRFITRKTSIAEDSFLKLALNETFDVSLSNKVEVVGIAFNMAQSNGILGFFGEKESYKALSTAYFDPERALWLVIWSLLKPVLPGKNGKLQLKCLWQVDTANVEFHDHGKYSLEKYADEPIRIEIAGLVTRHTEPRNKKLMMIKGLDLDLYSNNI
jgi:hypothetical protein